MSRSPSLPSLALAVVLAALQLAAAAPARAQILPEGLDGTEPPGIESEPEISLPEATLRLVVLPFEHEQQTGSRIGMRLATLLSEALAQNPEWSLQSPESAREELGRYLPPLSELMQPETAARLGVQFGVDALIAGQTYVLENRFYMVAKVVGCRSGVVVASGAGGAIESPLSDLIDILAPELDGLLAERQEMLSSAAGSGGKIEKMLKSRVTALRRQKEPPPIIVVVAEAQAGPGAEAGQPEAASAAGAARDRLVERVRRIGMSARAPRARDRIEWVRARHAGESSRVPEALQGRGMVLALLVQTEVFKREGTLDLGRAMADAVWLDAQDGAKLGETHLQRFALRQGPEKAAAAAGRILARSVLEGSLPAALDLWEARQQDDEELNSASPAAAP